MKDLLNAIKKLKGQKFAVIIPQETLEDKEYMSEVNGSPESELEEMSSEEELNVDVQPKKMAMKEDMEESMDDMEGEESMDSDFTPEQIAQFKKDLAKKLKG